MNICPGCRLQYEGDTEKCSQCGSDEKDVRIDKNVKDVKKDDWVHVTTVSNDIEFGMVAGLLEMGNIPAIKKVHGLDGYFQIILGTPLAGIDVLVPQDKYEEALQLLNAQVDESEFVGEDETNLEGKQD